MAKRIALIVEGKTEQAFSRALADFVRGRVSKDALPSLRFFPENGRVPKGDNLQRDVERHLKTHDDVIALTDVFTGSNPRDFADAVDAKAKMRRWVGHNPHFHPHAAQYEFEAWLLPYWSRIQTLSGTSRKVPSRSPERVNHNRPPSRLIDEAYRTGKKHAFRKTVDGAKILLNQDLTISAAACPELKAFLNTILTLAGAPPL